MEQELFFEIGTEEIPAGYIMPALNSIKQLLKDKLDGLSLAFTGIQGTATPRRLAIQVQGLADRQPDRYEEILGPPKKAAFDADNRPTKAAEGFAKSRGTTIDALKIVATPKGEYIMLPVETKGQPTKDLLQNLLPELITEIPFPKSMRWGSGRTSFARPIQWLLTIYGGNPVPCRLESIESANTSRGHRFMAPGLLEIHDYSQYKASLKEAHVLVDPEERKKAVLDEITKAALEVGGKILPDPDLLETVNNLVEKPFAICGSFEERFLSLPREVLITSMREHQKYFAVVDEKDELLPHFVAVNNTEINDKALAAEGHQRVLRARLEDALFFFKEDQARSLNDRVADLSGVIFQAKLGTLLEKTERITYLAGKLAQKTAPTHQENIQRAAHLAKADLLTDMVNEFPSLQGVIGRDYAILNNEKEEVATAIYEHYLPVRAGGTLPSTAAGAIVSIADRLDTITGCFGIGQIPTGTTDPFGLRRQALGLLHIVADQGFPISLVAAVDESLRLYGNKLTEDQATAKRTVLEFIKGRFVNDLTNQGIPAKAVEAVTSISFDDIVDCRLRINALVAISNQPEFALLAGAFKRVINIIGDTTKTELTEGLLTEPAEQKLYDAYKTISLEAQPFLDANDYQKAMQAILKMKEPVDNFFDEVMVMVDDENVRDNRLALLTAISRLFLRIGDFSKMHTLNQ